MEILLGGTALGNLIREGKTQQIGSHMQRPGEGMITLDRALLEMVEKRSSSAGRAGACSIEVCSPSISRRKTKTRQCPLR